MRSTHRVLVVEDERAQREALVLYLSRAGFLVEGVATGEEAIERLGRGSYAILLTDLRLPGIDGLGVVRQAHALDEELGVLLTTAYASVDSAVEALRVGAHDYLLKPLIFEEVARKIDGLLEHRELVRENARLRRMLQERKAETQLVVVSAAMKQVEQWVRRAAGSRATVLITGETGTGKEVVARAIHDLGPWREEPFLAVNLSAVPETLVESELFGHEKGAFTGADRRRDGVFRAAASGTVLLDEIAELTPQVQVKLLRALEERRVQPLGSDKTVPFEARVLVATHRDLPAMVERGAFREDLFYRLNVLPIHVPPLRERPEDVQPLAEHFLADLEKRGLPGRRLSPEALAFLVRYPFPGNVRELRHALEQAVAFSDADTLGLADFDFLKARADVVPQLDKGPEEEQPSALTQESLRDAMKKTGGNRVKAARLLGISRSSFYRLLRQLPHES